ncbi:MAG: hypothetical protein WD960_15055 [Gemmatimonadota bacterium]
MTEKASDQESGEKQTSAPGENEAEHIYANGLQVGLSNADVNVVLKLGGRPTHVLYMSYTLAKTLQQILGSVVERFESAVDREMLTTKQVDAAFKRLQSNAEAEEHNAEDQ